MAHDKATASHAIASFTPSDFTDLAPLADRPLFTVQRALLSGTLVALKSVAPRLAGSDADAQARNAAYNSLDAELRINSCLRQHPHIVRLQGCVRGPSPARGEGLVTALVFELCDGGALSCARYGLARLADALDVAVAVGTALCHAHAAGVMHRDVKPSQVMFCCGVPKLGDWGLARECTHDGCATGKTGTWEFVSCLCYSVKRRASLHRRHACAV